MVIQPAISGRRPVFRNGDDGIACYRIPAIVRLPTGRLVAFAEGRVANCGDHGGAIRVVCRTSDDDGVSWGPLITIARNILPDGTEQVAQNPCPVVDTRDPANPHGTLLLMCNKAEQGEVATAAGRAVRRIVVIKSGDGGESWTNERDVTTDVHRPYNPGYTVVYPDAADRYAHPDDWRAQFPSLGHGIQLEHGPVPGRLVVASYTTVGPVSIFEGQSYLLWSDDHGATWQHGEPAPVIGVNESMAVEREDGSILVNYRNYGTPDHTIAPRRGELIWTWDASGTPIPAGHRDIPELPITASGMQGSLIRRRWPDADGPGELLFSTCAHPTERRDLTLWRSTDDGRTWPESWRIEEGPSAYSDLVVLDDDRIGVLFETGGKDGIWWREVTLPPPDPDTRGAG